MNGNDYLKNANQFLNFGEEFDFTEVLDTPIYRVFKFEWLLELLITSENTLVKPKLWDDPFENFLFKSKITTRTGNVTIGTGEIRELLFGQCWTLNQSESDALWRIYSPDKMGIRVKTTIGKLFFSFYNEIDKFRDIKYFIGKVGYNTIDEIYKFFSGPQLNATFFDTSGQGRVYTLLFKRNEFKHENEVRLIYSANPETDDISSNLYKYKLNAHNLIDEFLFDPRFDINHFNILKKEFENMGFNNILKSDLYSFKENIFALDVEIPPYI